MATLEVLTDDLEKLSKKMFKSLEETNIKVYDKVLQGFKDTSGKCKDFIHDMGAMVIAFFGQAEKMEQGLAKCDAEAFREVINASKGHVCSLIEEVAEAESIYNLGEAKFNSILASVAKEVKVFMRQEGEKQRNEYKEYCLARIRQDHGRLDGTCFIPMIIGNLTAHQALAISQRVAHSHVPLKIMLAPLRTQAGAVKVYMRFVEFLAGRVIVRYRKDWAPTQPQCHSNQKLVVSRFRPRVGVPVPLCLLASLHLHPSVGPQSLPGMALLHKQIPGRRRRCQRASARTSSARNPRVPSSCGPIWTCLTRM